MKYTLTLQETHVEQLRQHLFGVGDERVAFLICGTSRTVKEGEDELRLLSRVVIPVPDEAVLTSSGGHVTWDTSFFPQVLKQADRRNYQVVMVHSHPKGALSFSKTDDINEPPLFETAFKRNDDALICGSVIMTPDGGLLGRVWDRSLTQHPFERIRLLGERFHFIFSGPLQTSGEDFHRQALMLGPAFNTILARLKIGVVGCGGTGTPTAMMLTRLGVGHLVLVDNDLVERTNIHRLHGISMSDVGKPKVEALASSIRAIGFDTNVTHIKSWANTRQAFDALKSCDVIFGCTDDNSGRLLLNRMAFFYLIPVIDMGLRIVPAADELKKLLGRVTVIFPGYRCLLCRGIIDTRRAGEDDLHRNNPEEYLSRLKEAYVLGGGNPDPAVITFTTETSTMAINELIHRLQGFRGQNGSVPNRIRDFYESEDLRLGAKDLDCELCSKHVYSGRGDCDPFLDGNFVS